ncbi:MAG: rod shape-determining protein MreD [bacterium]|nr:rod shape-determining protein MreD [bacterium]
MKTLRITLLLALALLLQTSWVHKIECFGLTPDLVLLVLVYIGISGGQIEGTVYGFISGFLLDIYDPQTMGTNALANSVVGFAVGYIRIGIVAEDVRVQALILFLAGLLHNLIYLAVYSLSGPAAVASLFLHYGLGAAAYTAITGIVISLLLRFWLHEGILLDAQRLHG